MKALNSKALCKGLNKDFAGHTCWGRAFLKLEPRLGESCAESGVLLSGDPGLLGLVSVLIGVTMASQHPANHTALGAFQRMSTCESQPMMSSFTAPCM